MTERSDMRKIGDVQVGEGMTIKVVGDVSTLVLSADRFVLSPSRETGLSQ